MKSRKPLVALLLAVALLATCLAGCGGQNTSDTADGSGTTASSGRTRSTTTGQADNSLTIAINDIIDTLDPQLFARNMENLINMQIFEPMFYRDNDGNQVNILIDSMTENEDGSVDFVLKEGIQFQSGDTLKAEDIAYTLERCETSPICSALYGPIIMTITDDTHFTWQFEGATFDDLYAYIEVMLVVNKSYCEEFISDPSEDLGFNTDGTGAYQFVEHASNGDVTLERFEGYHGEAPIDTLYFRYVTGSQETAFEAGDLDYATYTPTNFELIQEYENVTTQTQFLNGVTFLAVNCTEGAPTSDLRVRQAIAYCMNKDDITIIGSSGAGTPAYNLANPLVQHYGDVADHFEQDIETANALMTEAGYSESNPLELTLIVPSNRADWPAACEIMKEELEQSYFVVNIEQVPDTSRYFTYDFDLGMLSIILTTQFNSYAPMFQLDSGINLSGIDDSAILETFSNMTDEASTQEAMKAATESLAYIPLFYNSDHYAFDSNLNPGPYNVELSGFLYREFSWK